jgi:hypothetical protein
LLDANVKYNYLDPDNGNVRIVHAFAGNTPQLPGANANTGPQVFIYANGAKLNGNALSYGGQWPSPSVYATIPQTGNVRFDVVMARLNFNAVPVVPAPIAGDTLLTVNAQIDKGKAYSIYFGDSIGGPYKFEVKEDAVIPSVGDKYKIRVAHYIMNPTDTLDLFSTRQNANIISNVTIKNVTNWVELDIPVIVDTLYLRRKGTTTNYASVLINGVQPFSPTPTRMYTVVARGKNGVTGKGVSGNILINY